MGEALVVRHLSKRFGGLRAVQDLSFSVQRKRDRCADRAEWRRQDDEFQPYHRLSSARLGFGVARLVASS